MLLPLNAGIYNLVSSLSCQPLGLGSDLVDVADHVEGDLGQVIVLAGKDGLESGDGLVNGNKFARVIGEDLSNLSNKQGISKVIKLY